MTKKKRIIIVILVSIGVLSIACNAIWFVNTGLDRIRDNATITAQRQVIGAIFTSINQNGEVVITIPDGNGGNKKLILVTKEE